MKLYEVQFKHYSQKDSVKGIVGYLVAKNDESVYEWMKDDMFSATGYEYHTSYRDYEDDEGELDGASFKESVIKTKGCMFNDNMEVSDLYYGAIQYGWKLTSQNIFKGDLNLLKTLNIKVFEATK